MSKINVFFFNLHEEIEGLTVIDLLRRAGLEVDIVSITGTLEVTGSHHITIKADRLIDDVDFALKQIFNAYNLKGITMEVGE